MNLAEARTRVRRFLKDKKGEIPREDITDALNIGWGEVAHELKTIKKCITTSIVANQAIYRINPVDFIEADKAEVVEGNVKHPLVILPGGTLEQSAPADLISPSFPPVRCAIDNREGVFYLRLEPTPDKAVTNDPDNDIDDGLWFWYIKNHTPIFGDSEQPELLEIHRLAGLYWACWDLSGEKKWWDAYQYQISKYKSYSPKIEYATKEREVL